MTTIVSGSQITFNDNTTQNTSAYGGGFAMRNRIINGDMRIDQRNSGASITPTTDTYSVDRWQFATNVSSKASLQQSSTAPTGFVNSLLITSTSAYTVGAGEVFLLKQSIEGYNIADLNWGTANAQTITISFWVRSSLTGTFGGALNNSGSGRCYPFTYTISSANTWEQKTVTIAGDTSGTWLTTNGIGLTLILSMGCGSTFLGTANAWTSSAVFSATGSTNVVSTNGATFYITGVQLEKGSTATSFDYRPYSAELAMCQRYFQLIKFGTVIAQSTTNLLSNFSLLCRMRSSPSIGKTSGSIAIGDMVSAGYTTTSTPTLSAYDNNDIRVNFALAGFTGLTAYRSYQHEPTSGSPSLITVSAEL